MTTPSWFGAEFVEGGAQIGSITLRLSTESLSISSAAGSVFLQDRRVFGVSTGLAVWANTSREQVLATSQYSHLLYVVILRGEQVRTEHLFRDEEPDLRFLTFRPLDDGSVLMLYERGLLLVDSDGAIRWHRLHDDVSAHVVGVSTKEVILETQWPLKLAGVRRRFRLVDGEELVDA